MPDMTPQGLADAINDLVEDLPRRERPPNESWQKTLALQALELVLDWHTPVGDIVAAAVEKALEQALIERPALQGAIEAAFPAPDYHRYETEADDPTQTRFAVSHLGVLLRNAADGALGALAYDDYHGTANGGATPPEEADAGEA